MLRRVLIVGPPGAGKGTQAVRVAEKLGIAHISTGEMFRAAMSEETELGNRVREVVERGDLVSDDLVLEMVRARLNEDDARAGFMLDGFPRTVPQAEGLLAVLRGDGQELEKIVCLQVPDEDILERLLARGRTDDTEHTIRHRLIVYREQTEPVINFLEAHGVTVAHVEGTGSILEITDRITSVLDATDTAEERS